MAQECGFFNARLVGDNEYDRVYLAEQFAAYFASFIGNGVFGQSMQKLQVLAQTTPDMSVKVLSGEAWINGWWYRNTEEYTLSLDVADGVLNRIDVVVLRWGNAERDMWLQVIKGTASANPVKPAIRRDADYYDLQLATVSIAKGTIKITQSAIGDTRLDNAVCGLVTGVVDQIDTTDLYNQFETYFAEFKQRYEADFEDWTDAQRQAYLDYINGSKAAYDAWVAQKQSDYNTFISTSEQNYTDYITNSKADYDAWTAEQRAAYMQWYESHTTAWEAEFNAWFDHLKDVLSGDVAGNLQLEIEDLQNRVDKLEHFATDLVYKQEVYPAVIDTRYDKITGNLTNHNDQVITNDANDPIEVTAESHEPVLDNTAEIIRATLKFAIL